MQQLYQCFLKFSTLFFVFLVSNALSAQQCSFTLNLYDSFGDGWNGAMLSVEFNGDTTIYTVPDGEEFFTEQILVNDGDEIVFTYTGGTFEGEVSYELLDNDDNLIFSDGPNPDTGTIFEGTLTCISCTTPRNIIIEEILGDGIEFTFSEADAAIEHIIYYGFQGLPFDSLIIFNTPTSDVLLTGLEEDTLYQFYIVTVCGPGDTSQLAGPVDFETIFLNDVGITGITSPVNACNLGSETVTFNLSGFGSNLQSLFNYGYSVNGSVVELPPFEDGYFTGIVGSDDTVSVSFDTRSDFSEPGVYEIAVWTSLEDDSDLENDTFYYSFVSIPTIAELDYEADFSDNSEGWSADQNGINSSWEFGVPDNIIINSANTASNAWVTNLTGDYNGGEFSYLSSVCFDFSNETITPTFSLFINYDTERNYDGCWLEGSKDGGETWEKIGAFGTGINWYNVEDTFTDLENVWAGSSDGWTYAEHPLEGFAGESNCRFRFGFSADPSVNNEGIAIDDIKIRIPLNNDLQAGVADNDGDPLCGSVSDTIQFTFYNVGLTEQSDITAHYQVNGGAIVSEMLDTVVLAVGGDHTHQFSTPFNSNEFSTTFDIKVWVSTDLEENLSNDTLSFAFTTSTPGSLPIVEDFNDLNLPEGWDTDGTILMGHGSETPVAFRNLYNFVTSFFLRTGNIGPINPNDSLTFDYRIVNFDNFGEGTILGADSLIVEISTDCGENFTPLLVIDQNNHDPSAMFTNRTIDLADYDGAIVQLQFRAIWAEGDYYLDIDNINILSCGPDLGVEASIVEPTGNMSDGGIALFPAGGIGPYTYEWNTGDMTSIIAGITAGEYEVTVTDALLCEEVISFTLIPVSIEEIESLVDFTLFPNPASDEAYLNVSFLHTVDATVRISNALGQTVYQKDIERVQTIQETFDLTEWSSGVYFVQMMVDGKQYTRKLFRQ